MHYLTTFLGLSLCLGGSYAWGRYYADQPAFFYPTEYLERQQDAAYWRHQPVMRQQMPRPIAHPLAYAHHLYNAPLMRQSGDVRTLADQDYIFGLVAYATNVDAMQNSLESGGFSPESAAAAVAAATGKTATGGTGVI
ncbi:uncharacterized protein LOC129590529 [Paramacrobiotus metropolitanus]|uniref:uncharacterized protein LOC129590529 n=1 Tax=Paramacrobiotus metropolitanus TaxID=2943436 RepID=UPI002445EC2C|nr:uncharacterized protein LOC129590529 [Paramacrobiotus metropolitanus]